MSTVVVSLDVLSARPDLTNTPEMYFVAGTNFTNDGYAFTSGGSKALYFKLGADLYGTGNITLSLQWMSRSGSTTGNVQWVAALAAITPGDPQSIETKAFATSQNATTTVNSTAKGDTLTSISIVNLDSVSAGDVVWIKLTRGTDTMAGDAVLIKPTVSYSDGNSGSPGSGDVVGPASATTTAIAVFNGTTGKLIQNSAVSLDSSGNLTGVGTINGFFQQAAATLTADSSAITTTSTVVLTVAVPSAGTWVFDFITACVVSTVTANVTNHTVNFTGTQTRFLATMIGGITVTTMATASTNSNNTALPISPTVTSDRAVRISGSFLCSTTGNLTIAIQRASSGTIVMRSGSSVLITKIA